MNRSLFIALVTNNYTPFQGGVVSSIVATQQALQAAGHTVVIITLDFTGAHGSEKGVIRIASPIRFLYKKNHMAIPYRAFASISTLFDQLKPDIVHVHHPFLLGLSALQAAQRKTIPTIFTYHTIYEQYLHYVPLPTLFTQRALKARLYSFCASVNGIIAPGSYIANQIQKYAPQQTIQIIPSCIAEQFFQSNPQKTFQKPFKLLTVSRFTPEKNLFFLLDMIFLVRNMPIQLTLAGYGSELEPLKCYAFNRLRLNPEQIVFVEKPAKQALLELYKNAHLFLFASQSDTQALVLAEAMSQATPVIALAGPGQEDIINDGFNGYLVHTKREMAEKIVTILTNEPLWTSLCANATITAQRYTASSFIKKLMNFYSYVIKT